MQNCPDGQTCNSNEKIYLGGKFFLNSAHKFSDERKILELNFGFTNFDNIGNALLTVHQLSYVQGWSKIMYIIQNGYNFNVPAFFFISSIIILNYFILNFTIGIMLNSHREGLNLVVKRLQNSLNKTMNTVRFIDTNKSVNFYNLQDKRNKNEETAKEEKKRFIWKDIFDYFKTITFFKKVYPQNLIMKTLSSSFVIVYYSNQYSNTSWI